MIKTLSRKSNRNNNNDKNNDDDNINESVGNPHFAKKLKYLSNENSYFFDTAKCDLYHKDIRKPFGLKFLLELFLGIHIQGSEHDSIQDAVATMALYRCMIPEIQHWTNEKKLKKKENKELHQNKQEKNKDKDKGKQKQKNNDVRMKKDNKKQAKTKTFSFRKDKNGNYVNRRNTRNKEKIVNYAYKMDFSTDDIPTFGSQMEKDEEKGNDSDNDNTGEDDDVYVKNAIRNHAAYKRYLFEQ